MLELKGIGKDYKVRNKRITAVDDVNLTFRTKEFVAIVGKSGAGKTTLLNMIGGLATPSCGTIIYRKKDTADFSGRDWDSYRNNSVGFMFQGSSLLNHLSILENVMLTMTISGIPYTDRKKRSVELLEKMGFAGRLDRRPSQLSDGEKKIVTIARALANDPDILLCDEPTDSLDSESAIEVMDLIRKESRSRLVIMVTHNSEIADLYADRIITLEDGHVVSDTNPFRQRGNYSPLALKKKRMSGFGMLMYALKGLRVTRIRRIFMVIGYSIGILCIAIASHLAFGFQKSVDTFEENIMQEYPVVISNQAMDVKTEDLKPSAEDAASDEENEEEAEETLIYDNAVTALNAGDVYKSHTNVIDDAFLAYIGRIDSEICSEIAYVRDVTMHLVRQKEDGSVVLVQIEPGGTASAVSKSGITLAAYPQSTDGTTGRYFNENYEILAGRFPQYRTDLCLVATDTNQIDAGVLKGLGFSEEDGAVEFDQLVDMELQLLTNNDYYKRGDKGFFEARKDYENLINLEDSTTVHIVGVIRPKDGSQSHAVLRNGIVYNSALADMAVESARSSDIVVAQRSHSYNVMNGDAVDDKKKENLVKKLGGELYPSMIILYADDFHNKEQVLKYLDAYNKAAETEEEQVFYRDLSDDVTGSTRSILRGVSTGLLLVTLLALINCFFLLYLMTSDSVKARRKEVGVLRALGLHQGGVLLIFVVQSVTIGLITGLIGVIGSRFLMDPINEMIKKSTGLSGVLDFDAEQMLLIILLSVILSLVAAFIPALRAASRDPSVLLTQDD